MPDPIVTIIGSSGADVAKKLSEHGALKSKPRSVARQPMGRE
jgi:hypothetical protein